MGGEAMTAVDLLAPPTDAAVKTATTAFIRTMKERYGAKLAGVFLFGSRARGDYEPFSDIDIALVLDDVGGDSFADRRALFGLAYDVFFETGAEIEPWVFDTKDWNDPGRSIDAGLLRSIKRDSRTLWARP
jgi:antitoxin ChpS